MRFSSFFAKRLLLEAAELFLCFCAVSSAVASPNPELAVGEVPTAEAAKQYRLPVREEPLTNLDTPKIAPAVKPHALKSPRPVRLGIPYFAFPNSESILLTDTVAWLFTQFGKQLSIEAYGEEDMRQAVERGEIDLYIASAGFYREFAERGSKDLATLVDERKTNPNASSAAAVIVRKDRLELQNFATLKGARISAGFEDFFSGWHQVLYKLKTTGSRLEGYFSRTTFTGMPMSQIVDRVLSGEDDAGVLSACYLEGLQAAGYPGVEKLRVLEPQHDSLGCVHSIQPYPGLTIATMPSANPETMRAVARELFTMPASGSDHARWSVATNFSSTDDLLKSLALGPYRYLRHWTVSRLWDEYWQLAVIGLILVAGFVIHTFRTEAVVRTRTAQLRSAMDVQRRMQTEASEKSARIELLEREGVVQQLSSMLAHELRQPMTAIGFFTKGLISRLKRGKVDRESILLVLEKIRDLNQQSNAIVDHVRGYAKERIVREPTDVSEAVRNALQNLIAARYNERAVAIRTEIEDGLQLVADKFELELVVNNLVKNAIQACENEPNPEVLVTIRSENEDRSAPGILLTVSDNGPAITQEALSRIGRPFDTTKKDGLGLGTSIVRRIAESYGGRLTFRANSGRGLVAEVLMRNPLQPPRSFTESAGLSSSKEQIE